MYITHIVGMVLCVDKEFYVIQILELFYVEIIIFPVIFDGQTPPAFRQSDPAEGGVRYVEYDFLCRRKRRKKRREKR